MATDLTTMFLKISRPEVQRAAQYVREKYQTQLNEIYLDHFETEFNCRAVYGEGSLMGGLIVGFNMDDKLATLFLLKWG